MRRPGPTGSATTVTSGSLPALYRTSPVQSLGASASCGQISQPCAIVPCSTAAILGLFRLNAENRQTLVLNDSVEAIGISAAPHITILERARPRLARPLIPPPRLVVRRNESLTLRFRAQSVPSRLPRSNSSSVSRGPCATRLHKRNAAGPRCPCPKRSGRKAIPGCLCIHAAQIRACDAPGQFPRNAAGPRHHLAPAQTTKAIPMSVHPGCTNSGLSRKLWGFSRKRLCAGESHGACHLFAIARLCHRDKFRFLFAKCQALWPAG